MAEGSLMRMFPLNTVLFPRGVLPLQIFEPRYLALTRAALDGDQTFGVVLIERGSEVGGDDVRFDVGTAARIVRAGRVDRDRLAIVAIGIDRFHVLEWLDDDPYPQALVAPLPEADPTVDLAEGIERAHAAWRRVMAMASELGARVGTLSLELPDDQVAAMWTLVATAPLEQLDRQRLLEIDRPQDRLEELAGFLGEQAEALNSRLAGG